MAATALSKKSQEAISKLNSLLSPPEKKLIVCYRNIVTKMVMDEFNNWEGKSPTCKDLAAAVIEKNKEDKQLKNWLTPIRVGNIVRKNGCFTEHTSRGAEISYGK